MKTPRRYILIGLPIWVITVALGSGFLVRYAGQAGAGGNPPMRWPTESSLPPSVDQPVLVMFLHPKCPCSSASVANLARILARSPAPIRTHAAFVVPDGFQQDWAKTALWESASAIPSVIVSFDPSGAEATRFGAVTSGQTQLYDRDGSLVFAGGITTARGHEGDNAGADALISFWQTGRATTPTAPVFGCSLFDEAKPDAVNRQPCTECNRCRK